MKASVGVIGLGVIGTPIAERLVKNGFRVADAGIASGHDNPRI
jgi:3-hydroxyisobutyrate dehydrogenase-like beta-hydroxyacid dehydrogenase